MIINRFIAHAPPFTKCLDSVEVASLALSELQQRCDRFINPLPVIWVEKAWLLVECGQHRNVDCPPTSLVQGSQERVGGLHAPLHRGHKHAHLVGSPNAVNGTIAHFVIVLA